MVVLGGGGSFERGTLVDLRTCAHDYKGTELGTHAPVELGLGMSAYVPRTTGSPRS